MWREWRRGGRQAAGGGRSIVTIRATARLRLDNGKLSDLRRTVAAMVKYMPRGMTPRFTFCAGTTRRGANDIDAAGDSKDVRKLLEFGSGVASHRRTDLEVVVARYGDRRPGAGTPGHRGLRRASRRGMGRRIQRFLKSAGAGT